MVTGDHPGTAAAVAHEVDLPLPSSPVVDGAELPEDDAVLRAMLDHLGIVISRVSPQDKLRIARVLRAVDGHQNPFTWVRHRPCPRVAAARTLGTTSTGNRLRCVTAG